MIEGGAAAAAEAFSARDARFLTPRCGVARVDAAAARRLALALDGTSEADHHGRPSFRVNGRIFATLWDEAHLNVMVDEPLIRLLASRDAATFAPVPWGGRLAAVRVTLARADEATLREVLHEAWAAKRATRRPR